MHTLILNVSLAGILLWQLLSAGPL